MSASELATASAPAAPAGPGGVAGADGVSAALEAAVEQFAGMVRRIGWRHRLAEHELDELVQEVRIRLWRARGDRHEIAATPVSYVYRTAMTAALDLIRRHRAHHEDSVPPATIAGVAAPDPAASPEYAFEERELQHCLLRAVDALPDARRAVVRMHLAGHSRHEIAELLGWSEPKTRNLLYRGLADLRQRLAELGVGSASPVAARRAEDAA